MAATNHYPHTAFPQIQERRAKGTDRPICILLVEDDDDVRLLLTYALQHAGYEVSAVATADRALQLLRGRRHDLVLTDYCLPKKDGLQFLAEARSAGVLAGAPVIVCTAFPPSRFSGVTVLVKPIDLEALLQQIRFMVKR
jgi:DNA-binding response OmpR family regulator